ncbi:MAG: type II toxin-antitoxin system RelE/ParE family toxin [Deltaproteobacteria bacterium]|nr:type II toxin-antitoxin system RelE/ParE family toxin [Deltaproteobacteria bacterium]
MSHRVIVLDEAEDELIAAQEWYETQRAGLGREFRNAIDEAMERLLKAPLAASPVGNVAASIGARRVLVKRFPYSIVFIEDNEDLWIVAFAHHRRRPGYWRGRLES